VIVTTYLVALLAAVGWVSLLGLLALALAALYRFRAPAVGGAS
jgi:hypothetical protein